MAFFRRRRRKATPSVQVGEVPGTLTAPADVPEPVIRAMAHGPDELVDEELATPGQARPFLEECPVTRLDVRGPGVIVVVTIVMLAFFRRKGWLGGGSDS